MCVCFHPSPPFSLPSSVIKRGVYARLLISFVFYSSCFQHESSPRDDDRWCSHWGWTMKLDFLEPTFSFLILFKRQHFIGELVHFWCAMTSKYRFNNNAQNLPKSFFVCCESTVVIRRGYGRKTNILLIRFIVPFKTFSFWCSGLSSI